MTKKTGTHMHAKVEGLTKWEPQIGESEGLLKQENANKLRDTSRPKDEAIRKSQKPTFASMCLHTQLVELVHHSRTYLKEQRALRPMTMLSLLATKTSPTNREKASSTPTASIPAPQTEPILSPINPLPLIKPTTPIEPTGIPMPATQPETSLPMPTLSRGHWLLTSMPLPTEMPFAFSAFFPHLPLPIPIYLLVTDPHSLTFLEPLARAITQFLAPAALFAEKWDTLLMREYVQLILAPLSVLQKRLPLVQLHQLYPLDRTTLLPLADQYTPELKRALWKSLQDFRAMHLSS